MWIGGLHWNKKKLDQTLRIKVKIIPVQPIERRLQLYGQPQ
jgi:hypothetical protein